MLGLLLIVIIAVTSTAGHPTEGSMYDNNKLREVQQEDEKLQRLFKMLRILKEERVTGVNNAGSDGTVDAGDQTTSHLESEENCNGVLSSDQVQDIKFHKSDMKYIIINGNLISKKNPLDLFTELHHFVFLILQHNDDLVDIWFSQIPDSASIGYLNVILNRVRVKPVLHIESLSLNGTKLEFIRELGCLVKLSTNYHIVTWNWEEFSTMYNHCTYYSIPENNAEYINQTRLTERVFAALERDFERIDTLSSLCYI